MHKLLLSIAVLLASAGMASATPLTPQEALANIESFARHSRVKAIKADSQMQLGYTAIMKGQPTVYVFNNANQGYVIASADTRGMAVLGYSENGKFVYEQMPDNLKYWIDFYSQEIANARESDGSVYLEAQAADYAPIAPIAKTTWDQSSPYNNLCPTVNNRRCVTGCVATAMAQAMKCHNWPEKGQSSNSYTWNGSTLTADFSQSTYDWDNMLDNYDGTSTTEQRTAVATLMRDCGIGVNMAYSPVESGATTMQIPVALINYFNYDKGTHNLSREFYGLLDWEKIVYDELAAGRPVIYAGTTETLAGHCFLCDGYSSDRYFHINWGWNGMSDGYFRLSALTPEVQGIGGSNSGYNINQTITIGMQKPQEGSQYFQQFCCSGKFGTLSNSYRPVASDMVTFTSSVFYNASINDVTGTFGVKLTDEEGNVQYVAGFQAYSLAPSMGATQYMIMGNAFPTSGTYKVTPAFRTNRNKWLDMPIGINYPQYMILTASPTELKFEQSSMTATIKAKDLKFNSEIYSNANFSISATFYNDGDDEYYNTVAAALFDPATGQAKALGSVVSIDVVAGDELPLTYISKFSTVVEDGTYNFGFVDYKNRLISEPVSVEIKAASTDKTTSTLTNFTIPNAVDGVVPANHIVATGTINCQTGYFANEIIAYVFDITGGNALDMLGSKTLFVKAGESADFEIEGKFASGEVGTQYQLAIFVGSNYYPSFAKFTLGDPTGVVAVESEDNGFRIINNRDDIVIASDSKVVSAMVYDVSGKLVGKFCSERIDTSNLSSGIYIVVAQFENGRTSVARFAK